MITALTVYACLAVWCICFWYFYLGLKFVLWRLSLVYSRLKLKFLLSRFNFRRYQQRQRYKDREIFPHPVFKGTRMSRIRLKTPIIPYVRRKVPPSGHEGRRRSRTRPKLDDFDILLNNKIMVSELHPYMIYTDKLLFLRKYFLGLRPRNMVGSYALHPVNSSFFIYYFFFVYLLAYWYTYFSFVFFFLF